MCHINSIVLLILTVKVIFVSTYIAPSIFVNHGGGPYPVLGIEGHVTTAEALRNVTNFLDMQKLKAIIVVTAHRKEDIVVISSAKHHDLYYDYGELYVTPESYSLKYNATGHPEYARQIHKAFKAAGIPSKLDPVRGWDHGLFIPMMLISPKGDIPIIQVSILKDQDTKKHLELGKVLYEFRRKGIAVIGSGMTYHNPERLEYSFKLPLDSENNIENNEFDDYLSNVCTGPNKEEILGWQSAVGGLEAHPIGKAGHFLPLVVNIGAAGSSVGKKISEYVFEHNFKISTFVWG